MNLYLVFGVGNEEGYIELLGGTRAKHVRFALPMNGFPLLQGTEPICCKQLLCAVLGWWTLYNIDTTG